MQGSQSTLREPLLEDLPATTPQDGGQQLMVEEKQDRQLISPDNSLTPKKDRQDQKGQKQKGGQGQTPPVSFLKLISLADGADVIMMIIGSICALLAGCVMPLFSFYFGDLTTIYQKPDPMAEALKVAIKFWVIGAGAWITNLIAIYCWTVSGERQSLRYRRLYYDLLLKQEVHWYDINNPNELSTKISTEVTAIQGGIGQKVANVLSMIVTSTLGFFLAYFKNWRLSLVISALLPAIMLAAFLLMKAKQLAVNKDSKTYTEAGGVAEQAIGAIRTVKSQVGQSYQISKYSSRLESGIKNSIKFNMMIGGAIGFLIFVFLSSYSLGFWYGKKIIIDFHNDENNVGTVISCFFCVILGGASIGQAAPALKNIASAKSSAGEFFKLYHRKLTLSEPTDRKSFGKVDQIQFRDVVFRYKKKDELQDHSANVIDGINLKLEKNKVTAIVGESGSGKSTIVQLLERFYDPDQGAILVNGTDLKQLNTKQYRQQIGYVGQQPALFALSVRQNLRFAKIDATEQEMLEALRKANADKFILKMEKGLDTFVGTSGTQISGGQKQRIAIARAILKNPSLFVFDEATSALDRVNEKQIQTTLSLLSRHVTTLVIAHRLSTIQNAHKIVVLNKGRIVQEGTHEEMIGNKGHYYNLIKNQLFAEQAAEEINGSLVDNLPQRTGNVSVAQHIEEIDQSPLDDQQKKKEGAVFSRLLKDSSENWAWYTLGVFCASINGFIFPAFSFVLSKLIGLMIHLNNPEYNQVELVREINWYCLGFLGVALIGGITTFMYHSVFGYIGQKLVFKIRQKAFAKLMRMEVQYYDKPENSPGAVTTKLAQDAYLINNMTTGVLGVICQNVTTVIAGLFLAFTHHWLLTLIVLGLSPFIAVVGSINMKRLKALATQSDEAYKEAGTQISDTVTNIRTVKSFGSFDYILQEFNKKLEGPYLLAKSKAMTNGLFEGLSKAMVMIIYGLIFYLAAVINVKIRKHSSDQIFTAIFAIVFAAVGMGNNSQLLPDMAKGKRAGASVYQILDTQDEQEKSLALGGIVRAPIRGDIEFDNVCFKYPSRQKKVFSNLNLKIKGLAKTAFVGSSGCGKSTIYQLLLRFYEPTSGHIRIDGRDIKEYDLYSLREQIAVVFQQPALFTGSIMDNIKYKNVTASDEEVEAAARISQAHEFISEFKEKYDSDVGNKGSKLSGGQKQRIALARCLLTPKAIYMMDEATSALDTQTQKNVFASLTKVIGSKTSLSIAHRLSTIVGSDRILVFSEGEIIEEGTYEELVAKGGYFFRFERGQQ